MATETPVVPVVVPDENTPGKTHPTENVEAPNPEEESPFVASSGGNPVNDAACSFAIVPSAKMFEMVESVYCFCAS